MPQHFQFPARKGSRLKHPGDFFPVTDDRILRERVRHHFVAADEVLVDNHVSRLTWSGRVLELAAAAWPLPCAFPGGARACAKCYEGGYEIPAALPRPATVVEDLCIPKLVN